ncbi:MAG: transposase, partial [Magnetococcales bacterium]|nr:transposase [Magnetococcales bacterium]
IKEGIKEGQLGLLLSQTQYRFGQVPKKILKKISKADTVKINLWSRRILDARSLDDVFGR